MACFPAIQQLMLSIHALKLVPFGDVTDARSTPLACVPTKLACRLSCHALGRRLFRAAAGDRPPALPMPSIGGSSGGPRWGPGPRGLPFEEPPGHPLAPESHRRQQARLHAE